MTDAFGARDVAGVRFRDLARDELEDVREMAARIWRACYRGMIPDAQIEQMLGWMYAPGTVATELASGVRWEWMEVDGRRAGYVSWEARREGVDLHKLYLEPELHGRGLGQCMLRHVERRAAECGAPWVELRVNRANERALRAYRRAGYEWVGDDVRPIGGGFVMDDHILRRRVGTEGSGDAGVRAGRDGMHRRSGGGEERSGGEGGIRTPGSV